jgi:tetratricopeptide (TPR) repeat protein
MKNHSVDFTYILIPTFIISFSLISLLGCISTIKGEDYLSSKEYDSGITAFENQIKEKPNDASNHYYLGRFLMAQKKYLKANHYLKTAVSLKPGNDDYRFWLGLSYGGLQNDAMEMENYKKSIELNPKNVKAHIYLGHIFFRLRVYLKALESYKKALSFQSTMPSALYNKALILKKLDRTPEAIIAFKAYLKFYSKSSKAMKAVSYLNQMDDFDYRNHLIHRRKIVLKRIEFDPENLKLTVETKSSLNTIGAILKKNSQLTLHILSYQKNDISIAEQKATRIKEYLADQITGLGVNQVKTSWFPVPEVIQIGEKFYFQDTSINLFTLSK